MPPEDFDPIDAKPSADQPLADYVQPPSGLGMLATAQFVLAVLVVLLGVNALRMGEPFSIGLLLSIALPAGLLCAAGMGLMLRTAWGWWLTAALYYCVFFNLPINLILWTLRGQPFSLGANLVALALAIVVLAYITRSELLRFIPFRTQDGRPTRTTLISPAWAGFAWSVVRLLVALGTH